MKTIVTVWTILLCAITGSVFAQGIDFQKDTFEEAKLRAKKENKLLFLDFYTSWCGPCRSLSKNVFPLPEVGACFNKHFLSYKINAEVGEGVRLAREYSVASYPTLLFLDSEGKVVNRASGALPAEKLIETANKAVSMVDDPNNVGNLKKKYASHQNDEAFLKMYIEKMIQFKESPFEAIDQYLKIQTGMKKHSSRMMEYLLDHAGYLLVGGEGERIYKDNYDTYMDIATQQEEKKLKSFPIRLSKTTHEIALLRQDTALYAAFLKHWPTLPKVKMEYYPTLQLELLRMKGDRQGYHKVGFAYLDSLVSANPAEKVIEADKKQYAMYSKANPGESPTMQAMRASHQYRNAKAIVSPICQIGNELAKDATKKEFKQLKKWIEYGYSIYPDYTVLMNFEANLLYHSGEKEKGIELKKKVLAKESPTSHSYTPIKEGLTKMENGTF